MGTDVYAGVDYEKILRLAEQEHDVILWDGGNNDLPFIKPDVHITVVDPLRAGHEIDLLLPWPGELPHVQMFLVINKIDSATPEAVAAVRDSAWRLNPKAVIIEAASPCEVTLPNGMTTLQGQRTLVVEDGPTLTHGEMSYGAGVVTARKLGAELIDPRTFAVGTVFARRTRSTLILVHCSRPWVMARIRRES